MAGAKRSTKPRQSAKPATRAATQAAGGRSRHMALIAENDGPAYDTWVHSRGDVIWLEFDPQVGREQAGRRPAIVLSPATYNAPTGRALCVPVSSKAKGYPFEVVMPADFPIQGVAFADQVKCLDWRARHARPVGTLPPATLAALLARARVLLE